MQENETIQTVRTVDQSGNIAYTKDGEYHREDGPAIVFSDGMQIWCRNGKQHREDGPAIIYIDGTQEWYENGEFIKAKFSKSNNQNC